MAVESDEIFEVDFTKLGESLDLLVKYGNDLNNYAQSFEALKTKIQSNWTSDRADLESINVCLDRCINSINNAVVPVLNGVITTMYNMGGNTSDISSSTIG